MRYLYQLLGPRMDVAAIVSQIIVRLILAAFLGGIIGLEREVKHKPAGLRTQMFICFGSAFFTILSTQLAGSWGGDHTRIAAQIIPGIGFIGAGSILHSRGSVSGLTTAATLFVVASIGMAAGGGLYLPAIFATIIALLSLNVLGWMEGRFNLKPLVMMYEVVGGETEETLNTINNVMADSQHTMLTVHIAREEGHTRVQFSVDAPRREQEYLLQQFRRIPTLQRVQWLGTHEIE